MLEETTTKRLEVFLQNHHLGAGIGTYDEPCSIAAINLVLSGELEDDIPECMSQAIGHFIRSVQDNISDDMRNSAGWKNLLPYAAGTGNLHEVERVEILKDWMWGVLSRVQIAADSINLGHEWHNMIVTRDPDNLSEFKEDAAKLESEFREKRDETWGAYSQDQSSPAQKESTFWSRKVKIAAHLSYAAGDACQISLPSYTASSGSFALDASCTVIHARVTYKAWALNEGSSPKRFWEEIANPIDLLQKLIDIK